LGGFGVDKAKSLTGYLKHYDGELFAVCNKPPRIDVYRQSRDKLSPPHFIFSLTDNWTAQGRPVDWGVEPVISRLRAMDLWNSGVTADDVLKQNEMVEEGKSRDLRNNIESFLLDFRRQFAKATDGINTSTLDKTYRKENSHGYRK
jgi:hypothetical protein